MYLLGPFIFIKINLKEKTSNTAKVPHSARTRVLSLSHITFQYYIKMIYRSLRFYRSLGTIHQSIFQLCLMYHMPKSWRQSYSLIITNKHDLKGNLTDSTVWNTGETGDMCALPGIALGHIPTSSVCDVICEQPLSLKIVLIPKHGSSEGRADDSHPADPGLNLHAGSYETASK